jgi:uncharacterized protein YqgC (DUF456 family)
MSTLTVILVVSLFVVGVWEAVMRLVAWPQGRTRPSWLVVTGISGAVVVVLKVVSEWTGMPLWYIAPGLLMAVGLAGVIMPFVPGLPIIWGAALLYGIATEFGRLGWMAMIAITLLLAVGMAASIVLPDRAGAAAGASRSTRLFAGLLGLIGFFVVPVIGFPLGACLGVLIAQYRQTDDWDGAIRSTIAVLKGFGVGILAELGAGLAMVLVWVAWVVLD